MFILSFDLNLEMKFNMHSQRTIGVKRDVHDCRHFPILISSRILFAVVALQEKGMFK